MFAFVKTKSVSAMALCVEKGDRRGTATLVRRVTVYPKQRAATCKIYGNTVKSHHGRSCEFRRPPSAIRRRCCRLYTLFTPGHVNLRLYLLAARSCRGRGGPSKRVSDIHASVRTHPNPVARNMRSGDRREHEDASGNGHLCDGGNTRIQIYYRGAHVRESTRNLEFHLHS